MSRVQALGSVKRLERIFIFTLHTHSRRIKATFGRNGVTPLTRTTCFMLFTIQSFIEPPHTTTARELNTLNWSQTTGSADQCQRPWLSSTELLLQMLCYYPRAVYVPGKQLVVADTPSRHLQTVITTGVCELIHEVKTYELGLIGPIWHQELY